MSLSRRIKNYIIKIGDKSTFGNLIYSYSKYSVAKTLGIIWSEEHYAKWFYHLYTNKTLNLENPRYFDEKIWWLKLNNRDPRLTQCSDKIAVRKYIKKCGLSHILIPQLDVAKSTKEINLAKYKEEIVIKCNHNSGGHMFYDPLHPMSAEDIKNNYRILDFYLKQNASVLSREWNYKNIKPRLVIEKVIRDQNGNLPLDYKFMCFDGNPKLLFLDLGVINQDSSYNHYYPRNIYDMNFNLLPVYETRPNADYPVYKPDNFEKMVEIARKISRPFPFCRVDLYNVDGNIYFGEITFYHGGGCNDIQPEEWDLKMGSWINLNNPKIVRKKL